MIANESAAEFNQPQLFEMGGITPEQQPERGWEVEVDTEPLTGDITEARFANDRLGIEFQYGLRPEGYDGVVIHERGGGGAVTIPYMVHPETGGIYVGLVEEYRPTLGGNVWNVPRGMLDSGDSHEHTAKKELLEETGYVAVASRVVQLAVGLNPNSTYFNTSGTNEDGSPEGVSVFGIQVLLEELELAIVDGVTSYVFPQHIQDVAQGDKATEKIFGTRFVPITEAVKSRDMFTSAAAGQLLAELYGGNIQAAVRVETSDL